MQNDSPEIYDGWIVVVGASAGGVTALTEFVTALEPSFPAPILVVLHFPENSISYLPSILSRAGHLVAAHAVDGEPLVAGRIYVDLFPII
jgi:two-component system chemotaxis response regulator CheB